jgi:hypothetical protein
VVGKVWSERWNGSACGSSMESDGRWWAMMVGGCMYFYDMRTTDDVLGMRAKR